MRLRFLEDQEVTLFAAIPVGILAGIVTTLFKDALEASGLVMFHKDADIVLIFAGLALAWRVVIPALGGALAGALLVAAQRYARTESLPSEYMEAVARGTGRLPVKITLLRALASFCSIVSGSSVGKEGAMIQLAALTGSVFPSSRADQAVGDSNMRRMLTACGAAAGLATAYHTPLSAAVFVAEVVFGALAVQRLMPLFLASVAGTMVSQWRGGLEPLYSGLHIAPDLLQQPHLMLAAAGIGVIAGVSGALFMRANTIARNAFGHVPGGPIVRLALGGLLVGSLAVVVPEVVGNGYYTIQTILHNEPLSVAVWGVLLAKLLATVISMGSGAVGGVFTPSMFVGAALGQMLALMIPDGTATPVLPLVGMTAFLAATSQAPLMSILMVFEMTLAPTLLLPLMIGAVAAFYTASRCQTLSLYSVVVERAQASAAAERARGLRLAGLCDPTDTVIDPSATLAQTADKFAETGTRYLYVVDAGGALLGAVSIHAVQRAQRDGADPALLTLCDASFPSLTPDSRLRDALAIFSEHGINRIPLIRDAASRELLGTVSKQRVLQEASCLF
ncbi:ClcB-like voltage-gated chloride channel protein [Cupriavidus pauculus]|uniref:ClcB-like voltage-gated chloride channel protein n=1 Tax=Cupriavidus pauculus TaxID=82633 RepID=UPI001244EDFC|nr:ClcB-like voltage-gated chloride channel protein [Cupriavidus pauculus]KAB0603158.1 ClcB-like voltage-gated chloride channel protein [Cupriavidus pauculus]MCM3604596.1 ClcB-like voltage-gated chloride channel protein [Cupriavidus pauculus]UAK98642.1 ClcB-like voltage-gated chloride channel protein [Cupriavidus pauculus]